MCFVVSDFQPRLRDKIKRHFASQTQVDKSKVQNDHTLRKYADISTHSPPPPLISPVHVSEELLLSAPQPVFRHGGYRFSNALLLHRLVATGHEEQVVSRRGELNRDLVKRTCTWMGVSKVR